MERFFQYKKHKLENETNDEFYLNPKDMINNDKVNENIKWDVFQYLPINELFGVVFEDNVAVIDIKRTICKNFTILKMISVNEIYTKLFKSEIVKVTKFPIQNSLSNFCYKIRENDLKKVKNCLFIENQYNLGTLYYILEFSNLEFAILKYNNITQHSQYEVIYTHLKNHFLTLNTTMKVIYESPLIFNYNTSLSALNNNENAFYIIHLIECYFFIFELDCHDDTYKHKYTIKGEGDIKMYKCVFNRNEFIIVSVTDINKVYKQSYSLTSNTVTLRNCIECDNKGNITLLSYNSKYVIYVQLNKVNVYSNIKEKLISVITIQEFEDCVINHCFIFDSINMLYVFNANGDYVYAEINLEQSGNDNVDVIDITSNKKTLSISKLIYAIIPFQNEFGFFILSTQNPIKLSNVSITYFIPEPLIQNQTFTSLTSKHCLNKDSFYTFSLCEYLIYTIRFNPSIPPNTTLLTKRINYYMNYIFNNTNDITCINDILSYYRIQINQVKDSYQTYINNSKYKCDFCESEYIQYKEDSNIYLCKNEHESFACCIKQIPFMDHFLYCSYCNLYYSNTFKICLICQIILDNAI